MEKVSNKKQICFCSFISIILVLVLPSFFFFFLVSVSSLTLLTTLVVLFSTMFLVTLTRTKVSLGENRVQNNFQKPESQSSLGDYDDDDVTQNEVTKGSDDEDAKRYHEKQGEEAQKIDSSFPSDSEKCCKFSIMDKSLQLNAVAEEYDEQHIADPNSDSSSLPSDSESGTSSIKSEGSENDFRRNQNLGISEILAYDYDDDDEEEEEDSLIEIKLPNSNFFGLDDDEDPKQNLESNNLPEFLPESIFKHKGLMELLEEINEMNEDENLIEIDLSIGSTKCHQDLRVNQELAYYEDQ